MLRSIDSELVESVHDEYDVIVREVLRSARNGPPRMNGMGESQTITSALSQVLGRTMPRVSPGVLSSTMDVVEQGVAAQARLYRPLGLRMQDLELELIIGQVQAEGGLAA